jgi:hypothetical protein
MAHHPMLPSARGVLSANTPESSTWTPGATPHSSFGGCPTAGSDCHQRRAQPRGKISLVECQEVLCGCDGFKMGGKYKIFGISSSGVSCQGNFFLSLFLLTLLSSRYVRSSLGKSSFVTWHECILIRNVDFGCWQPFHTHFWSTSCPVLSLQHHLESNISLFGRARVRNFVYRLWRRRHDSRWLAFPERLGF